MTGNGFDFFFRIKKSLFSFEARCRVLSDPTLACDTRVCLNHLLIILRADSVGEESAAAVAAAAALSVPIIWCVSPASSSLFLPRFPFFLSSFFPRLWRRSIITCTWWVSSVTTDESLSYFPVTVRIVPMNFNFNLSFPFNFLFFAVGIFLFELALPPPCASIHVAIWELFLKSSFRIKDFIRQIHRIPVDRPESRS